MINHVDGRKTGRIQHHYDLTPQKVEHAENLLHLHEGCACQQNYVTLFSTAEKLKVSTAGLTLETKDEEQEKKLKAFL